MFESLLNKTATLYKVSYGSANSFGELSQSRTAYATFKCAIQPVREQLNFHIGGVDYVVTDKVFCEYGIDIVPGDYIEIEDNLYLILNVLNAGGRDHHYELLVRRN